MRQKLNQLKLNLTWVKKSDSSDSNSQPYSPVDEIVEDDEDEDGHDGGGEEGVDDEALGEPLDVVGVRAQARHFKVYGAVRLHGL